MPEAKAVQEQEEEQENLRTVNMRTYPQIWDEFEIAIINEFSYKKTRTDVMVKLVQEYVDKNSAFLYPEGDVIRMSDAQIEAERKKIVSTVGKLEEKLGEKKKTTMQVPTALWNNLHIIIKRKFWSGRPGVAVVDIILTLLVDYLDRKKKFLSPSKSKSS